MSFLDYGQVRSGSDGCLTSNHDGNCMSAQSSDMCMMPSNFNIFARNYLDNEYDVRYDKKFDLDFRFTITETFYDNYDVETRSISGVKDVSKLYNPITIEQSVSSATIWSVKYLRSEDALDRYLSSAPAFGAGYPFDEISAFDISVSGSSAVLYFAPIILTSREVQFINDNHTPETIQPLSVKFYVNDGYGYSFTIPGDNVCEPDQYTRYFFQTNVYSGEFTDGYEEGEVRCYVTIVVQVTCPSISDRTRTCSGTWDTYTAYYGLSSSSSGLIKNHLYDYDMTLLLDEKFYSSDGAMSRSYTTAVSDAITGTTIDKITPGGELFQWISKFLRNENSVNANYEETQNDRGYGYITNPSSNLFGEIPTINYRRLAGQRYNSERYYTAPAMINLNVTRKPDQFYIFSDAEIFNYPMFGIQFEDSTLSQIKIIPAATLGGGEFSFMKLMEILPSSNLASPYSALPVDYSYILDKSKQDWIDEGDNHKYFMNSENRAVAEFRVILGCEPRYPTLPTNSNQWKLSFNLICTEEFFCSSSDSGLVPVRIEDGSRVTRSSGTVDRSFLVLSSQGSYSSSEIGYVNKCKTGMLSCATVIPTLYDTSVCKSSSVWMYPKVSLTSPNDSLDVILYKETESLTVDRSRIYCQLCNQNKKLVTLYNAYRSEKSNMKCIPCDLFGQVYDRTKAEWICLDPRNEAKFQNDEDSCRLTIRLQILWQVDIP